MKSHFTKFTNRIGMSVSLEKASHPFSQTSPLVIAAKLATTCTQVALIVALSCAPSFVQAAYAEDRMDIIGQSPAEAGNQIHATDARQTLAGEAFLPRGVNLSGAEFGETHLPGQFGKDYTYPTAAEFDYYKTKGINTIRLPFRWERVQHTTFGALDKTELARIDKTLADASNRGLHVILDLHNYGRFYDNSVGSSEVPVSAFADVWKKLATHFSNSKNVWAFGMMNEPHDMPGKWSSVAQAAMDSIRLVDKNHLVLVPGNTWSDCSNWAENNPDLEITDSAHKFAYEGHCYFDPDHSGKYKDTYESDGAYPDIGVDKVKPFVEWLRQHNATGFIGEFGVPATAEWLKVEDRFLTFLDQNRLGATAWSGGPWWNDYILSVEPKADKDKPQLSVLMHHLKP